MTIGAVAITETGIMIPAGLLPLLGPQDTCAVTLQVDYARSLSA